MAGRDRFYRLIVAGWAVVSSVAGAARADLIYTQSGVTGLAYAIAYDPTTPIYYDDFGQYWVQGGTPANAGAEGSRATASVGLFSNPGIHLLSSSITDNAPLDDLGQVANTTLSDTWRPMHLGLFGNKNRENQGSLGSG